MEFFTTILNMSFIASIIAILVFILRLFLRKVPRIFSYLLWSFVFIRLILPFSFESSLSIFNLGTQNINTMGAPEFIAPRVENSSNPIVTPPSEEEIIFEPLNTMETEVSIPNQPIDSNIEDINPVQKQMNIIEILPYVWLIGMIFYVLILCSQDIQLRKKLQFSIRIEKNIYECEEISMPFLYGIIKPKIFLPSGLSENQITYIVAHEKIHLKRFDYLIKMIATILLGIHWFNPILWISYNLMMEDMEMSCDEGALKILGLQSKRDYGITLLQLSSRTFTTSLAFSESKTKTRIKNIANYKKPSVIIVILVLLCLVILFIPIMSNPKQFKNNQQVIEQVIASQEYKDLDSYMFTYKYDLDNINVSYKVLADNKVVGRFKIDTKDQYVYIDTQSKKVIATGYTDEFIKRITRQETMALARAILVHFNDYSYLYSIYEEAIDFSGDNKFTINNVSFAEIKDAMIMYVPHDADSMYIEISSQSGDTLRLLYNYTTRNIEEESSNFNRIFKSKDVAKEILDIIVEYYKQDVANTMMCAVLPNNQISCPNDLGYTVPKNISMINPIKGSTMKYNNDDGTMSFSLESNEKIAVMSVSDGEVMDYGENEKGKFIKISSAGKSVLYEGLSNDSWFDYTQAIEMGQVIGFILPTNGMGTCTISIDDGFTENEFRKMFAYTLRDAKNSFVIEERNYDFKVSDDVYEQLYEMVQNTDAFDSYANRDPVLEEYLNNNLSITAQINDFPTVSFSQDVTSGRLLIDKQYLIKEEYTNFYDNMDASFVITFEQIQSYTQLKAISFTVSFSNGSYSFSGYYDFALGRIMSGITDLDSIPEDLVNAVNNVIITNYQTILEVDNKVNTLIEQMIRVIEKDVPMTSYQLETFE